MRVESISEVKPGDIVARPLYDDLGRVCHQSLASMPVEVRQRHGDRVIALALAWRAVLDLPLWRDAVVADRAPEGSLNWRRQQREGTAQQQADQPWYRRGA